MNLYPGQKVTYAGKQVEVVGVISAFMVPGQMPPGIDDIAPKYLEKEFDKSKWKKDSVLIKVHDTLVRIGLKEVSEAKETKKRKK